MQIVLNHYGLSESDCTIEPLGKGLINTTWLIKAGEKKYVLQKINHRVFNDPWDIAFNIRLLANYLQQHNPDYLFTSPVQTLDGNDMVQTGKGYFRMFVYVNNSHTIDVAEKPEQAYEAAKQFGRFTRSLAGFDANELKITLPDFHNLSLRYQQFENALQNGNSQRIQQASELISFIHQYKNIVNEFENSKKHLKPRCTHHDTKISNVLFDENNKGLCVIDLDTVMPGYFISDVGDMMRTYLCPVSEEEKDFSKIHVRKEFYDAIIDGYLSEMGGELSATEKKYFHYAGEFMIYMQAIRFLTDHLNNDVYYGAKYEGHNFIRAGNQVTLLEKYNEINPG